MSRVAPRVDPDHRASSPFQIGARTPQHHAPIGTPIPGGIGGAVFDGQGRVLRNQATNHASVHRLWNEVRAARRGIPAALPSGDLPPGLHQAQWGEITQRYTFTPRRVDLTTQLGRAMGAMHAAGVQQAVIGGSYVGAKVNPGDVDIAIVPRADGAHVNLRRLERTLQQVAPDVHIYDGSHVVTNATTLPGATPGENFQELFQHTRDGTRRGALLVQPMPPRPTGIGGSGLADDIVRGVSRLVLRR